MKWGARVLRARLVPREEAWASAGVQSAWVGGCGCEADWGVFVFVFVESEALFVAKGRKAPFLPVYFSMIAVAGLEKKCQFSY